MTFFIFFKEPQEWKSSHQHASGKLFHYESVLTYKLYLSVLFCSSENSTEPYSSLPAEAKFVNSLGLLIVAFGLVTFGILSNEKWQRPEEDAESVQVSMDAVTGTILLLIIANVWVIVGHDWFSLCQYSNALGVIVITAFAQWTQPMRTLGARQEDTIVPQRLSLQTDCETVMDFTGWDVYNKYKKTSSFLFRMYRWCCFLLWCCSKPAKCSNVLKLIKLENFKELIICFRSKPFLLLLFLLLLHHLLSCSTW